MKTNEIYDGCNPWYLENKIKPNRYVWHVTYRSVNRSFLAIPGDFSLREKIRKEGLVYNKNWALFAQNELVKPEYIFPFCIDHFTFGDNINKVMNTMSNYDFWRIDTLKIKNEWFIDPLMVNDINKTYPKLKKHWFICTRQNVPANALKLFTFNDNHLEDIGKIKLTHFDGVISVNVKKWTDNFLEHNWLKKNEISTRPIAA